MNTQRPRKSGNKKWLVRWYWTHPREPERVGISCGLVYAPTEELAYRGSDPSDINPKTGKPRFHPQPPMPEGASFLIRVAELQDFDQSQATVAEERLP